MNNDKTTKHKNCIYMQKNKSRYNFFMSLTIYLLVFFINTNTVTGMECEDWFKDPAGYQSDGVSNSNINYFEHAESIHDDDDQEDDNKIDEENNNTLEKKDDNYTGNEEEVDLFCDESPFCSHDNLQCNKKNNSKKKTYIFTLKRFNSFKDPLFGFKAITCERCRIKKTFETDEDLKKHNNKMIDCSHCNKHYKTIRNQKEHMRRVHLHEKEVFCPYCNKKLSTKYYLQDHVKKCINFLEQYLPECPYCNKIYTNKKEKYNHIEDDHALFIK